MKSSGKSLSTVVYFLGGLMLVYAGYMIYRMASGTWNTTTTLGISGIGLLVVGLSILSTSMARIAAEIKKRETES